MIVINKIIICCIIVFFIGLTCSVETFVSSKMHMDLLPSHLLRVFYATWCLCSFKSKKQTYTPPHTYPNWWRTCTCWTSCTKTRYTLGQGFSTIYISQRAKESSKIHAWGPKEHHAPSKLFLYIFIMYSIGDQLGWTRGSQLYFMEGQRKFKNIILEGQMNTYFWDFPIYFFVFQRWSKGQTKLVGGPGLGCGPPFENPWAKLKWLADGIWPAGWMLRTPALDKRSIDKKPILPVHT